MVNRPLRDMAQRRHSKSTHQPRPDSRGSNVSKRRAGSGSLASSPMSRQQRVNVSHEFTTGMARIINQFTQRQNAALQDQKARYRKYAKRLKRDVEEGSEIIARQITEIDAQTKKIQDLQTSEEQLAGKVRDMEAKLMASEDRARRLEEKYQICKAHLNSAIQEQQDLYTRSKKQWQEAIEQMRATEKAQNAEAEMAVRKAEVIREQMAEKVRQAIAQNKSEVSELYRKIDVLTQQLEGKGTELRREREAVETLTQRVQCLQATSSGFDALTTQSNEILNKLREQDTQADKQHINSGEEIRDKLDSITNQLEALSNMTLAQPDVLSSVQEAQHKLLCNITAKLDEILKSQEASKQDNSQLSIDLGVQVGEISHRLDNQLEALAKRLEEKAKENGMVSTLYKRKVAECEEHVKELASLRKTAAKQVEQIRELETNLVAMDAAHDDSEETIRQLRAAGAEAARLTEEVQSKAIAIAELQSKLDAKDRAYVSEVQSFTSNVAKLAQSMQEKDQSLRAAADQAAETARREARIEMERSSLETKKLVLQAESERNLLANEVERLKQEIQQKDQKKRQDTATIQSLEQSLSSAEAKGKAAAQELTQQSAKQGQLESRLVASIKTLETKLEASQERAAELEGESHRQHARSQALVGALKHWALQVGLDISVLDCLNDSDTSIEEIGAGLARVLRQSSFPQKPQTAAAKECPEDTQLCDGTSKFFPGDAGQLSHGFPGNQAEHDLLVRNSSSSTMSEHAGTEGEALEDTVEVIDPHLHRHHPRRVIVRSPASVPAETAPPSIDQEKIRRREALQPKSIMKRVTRSTSSILQQQTPDGVSENNTAVRDTDTPSTLPGDKSPGAEVTSAPDVQSHVHVRREPSERSNKRRRSDTPAAESSSGRAGRSKQVKAETSGSGGVVRTEELFIPNSQLSAHHQEQFSNEGNPQTESGTARSARRGRGSASQGPPSVNTRQVLGLKQGNVRTYGSQRAEKPSTGDRQTDSQISASQSQPQPRYRSRSKESQGSLTFSQDSVNKGEDLLLPL
ncbi:hypothetical protein MFIFM68171_05954 [Madurella fahalii]|uniref:Uncharacterized protein n=1 Tax=Madurella fahalii TaxID=1157608 RepID=A0ABQ0GD98_9PEZI